MVAIGSDHAGFDLKKRIVSTLKLNNISYKDFGTYSSEPVDYPEIGVEVSNAVSSGKFEYGILICGTGIGMSIVANKIPRIRAALCYSEEIARLSRIHNNANILTMGARFIDHSVAEKIALTFLSTSFQPGNRHERRIQKIHRLTNR